MLEKTMKSVLTKKVSDWINSVDDINVKLAIGGDLIITGGCFTSMILNEPINDFDCYFRTKESLLLVAEYYAKKWNDYHKGKVTGRGDFATVMVLDGANPSQEILDFYKVKDVALSFNRTIASCPPERVKMIFPSDGIVGNPENVNASEELGLNATEVVSELDDIAAKEVEEKVSEGKKYVPVFISSNAITLSGDIQLVVRFYGEPLDIHDTYDFEHTKAYFDFGRNFLSIPPGVYEKVINKTLVYTGSKYPLCSLFRMRKFINRGWTINAGQIVKACVQISQLDLMNIDVLEDQLIGVDSLYFMNLIDQFRKQQEQNKDWDLTSDYLISVIDKIF